MLAGVVIGLSLVVKPVLAVLLLLPLLNRQWRVLVAAFVVPVVFNVAAWPLVADPMNFVRRTLPTSSRRATTSTAQCWATACTTACRCG